MDRNWDELLQELRVTQTGAQILTGFLLTIPFQQRFGDLDAYQQDLYLVLVVLAALATALIVAPVSVHRVLFRKRMKPELVDAGNVLARAGLAVLGLALAGSASFVFDVVLDRTAGYVVGAVGLAVLAVCWWLLPVALVRAKARD
ncbi:sodium:proton antiporter [Cellulomonas sp. DKR-3]|uniref:Sodium:proton antiporter n=1 Tax=Cellulomonas fulva TaxID=2835530 RepID=A0ABS5U1C1_9CELL|nr:sodium:proton antiporter [Cellulomonas fulva]